MIVLLSGATVQPSGDLRSAKFLEYLALKLANTCGFAQLREVVLRKQAQQQPLDFSWRVSPLRRIVQGKILHGGYVHRHICLAQRAVHPHRIKDLRFCVDFAACLAVTSTVPAYLICRVIDQLAGSATCESFWLPV